MKMFIVFMPPFAPSVEALRGVGTSLEAAKNLVDDDKVTSEFRRTRPHQWECRRLFDKDCHVAEYDAEHGKAHAIIVEIKIEGGE